MDEKLVRHVHEESEYVKIERNSRGFTYSVKAASVERAIQLLKEIKVALAEEAGDA